MNNNLQTECFSETLHDNFLIEVYSDSEICELGISIS